MKANCCMELEKFQEIQQWLIKSERDLGAARFYAIALNLF
jgi:hypothetical protein